MYVTVLLWCVLGAFSAKSEDSDTSVVSECPAQALTPVYKSLGCAPLHENDSECITSYDCSSFDTRDPKQCHTSTNSYPVSATVKGANACNVGCYCREGQPSEGVRPQITCAVVDCPWGGLKPGCSRKYSSDQCCPSVECEEKEYGAEKVTCTFENKTMQDGETFTPLSAPCMTCTCQKGFRGIVEKPFCTEDSCDSAMFYSFGSGDQRVDAGCAPVFYGNSRCCPISWQCPEKSDVVVKAITKSNIKTAHFCKFGALNLSPGDTITPAGPLKVQCSCELPPLLTCVQQPYE